MAKTAHEKLKKSALSRAGVMKAYEALSEEFSLLEAMLKARLNAGKTQDDVARVMNTSTSVVGRLETGGGKLNHSPTIETLRRYAKAVDCDLEIKFVKTKDQIKNDTKTANKKHKTLVIK